MNEPKRIAIVAPDFVSGRLYLQQTKQLEKFFDSRRLGIGIDGTYYFIICCKEDMDGKLFDGYEVHPAYVDRLIQEVKLRIK